MRNSFIGIFVVVCVWTYLFYMLAMCIACFSVISLPFQCYVPNVNVKVNLIFPFIYIHTQGIQTHTTCTWQYLSCFIHNHFRCINALLCQYLYSHYVSVCGFVESECFFIIPTYQGSKSAAVSLAADCFVWILTMTNH